MVPLRFQYFLNNQVWGWSRCLKFILLETTCMCMFVFAYICLCLNSKDILTLNMQCPRNQTSLSCYWIKNLNWRTYNIGHSEPIFLNARYALKCKARKCYICNKGMSLTLLRLLFYIRRNRSEYRILLIFLISCIKS